MLPDDKIKAGKDEKNVSPAESIVKQDEHVTEAHEQADADIDQDPDFSIHSPNDDLDEGELARLGDDENDII